MIITPANWPTFAKAIASPSEPTDYNSQAVDRLMDVIDKYVVRVKNVHPQFKAINSCQLINFQSAADRQYYDEAWERYLKEKAKIEGEGGLESKFAILVQFLKFRQAAEYVRAPYLAKAMYESVKLGKAAACATNFRGTITRAAMCLIQDYGVDRDLISLIWGGSQVVQTKKGALKKKITENEELMELMKQHGLSLEGMNLGDSVEVKEEVHIDPKYRMGSQSKDARQSEIDRFQRGSSLYCFFTFKAGGVGLSLHHTDEMTEFKCRRKPSGYAYEEDIPLVPTRPRECYLAPTYSAIECVQGLGRCPRLTSLSDTNQTILYFRGTIEERIKAIQDMKLRCLSRVIRQRESWDSAITGSDMDSEAKKLMQDNITPDDDDSGGLLGNVESDDD